jgi:4a-hydroxytetrahydrobiopterin dehydratase
MRLSREQVVVRLGGLPGWAGGAAGIHKTFTFPDFRSAIAFVNRVAGAAEELDHHPDIDVRYDRVRLFIVSHDAGGVTERDFRLARRVEDVASA